MPVYSPTHIPNPILGAQLAGVCQALIGLLPTISFSLDHSPKNPARQFDVVMDDKQLELL